MENKSYLIKRNYKYASSEIHCSDYVGPVGACGTLSPTDSKYVGPVGPYGKPSPSDSDSVGHVGPYGTLSPSDTAAVGAGGPDGTLSSSDPARVLFPAVPAGIPSPVGLIGSYGTLCSDRTMLSICSVSKLTGE